jgi:uncharacterized membrane protein
MAGTGRLRLLDALRGFSVLSMVAFHFCYDLKYIAGHPMTWFAPPFMDIWRSSISWTFLTIAGIMCAFSRNNFKRAGVYGAVAAGVWRVTTIAAVDAPISFGIIFCMAASTLFEALLEKARLRPEGPLAAALLFCAFLVALGVPRGYIGLFGAHIELLDALYATEYFSWLGLPGPTFVSGDYYPMIPFTLLFLAGAAIGWWGKRVGFPDFLYERGCAPLEFVGTHALPIYVLHQPVLLLVANLF